MKLCSYNSCQEQVLPRKKICDFHSRLELYYSPDLVSVCCNALTITNVKNEWWRSFRTGVPYVCTIYNICGTCKLPCDVNLAVDNNS